MPNRYPVPKPRQHTHTRALVDHVNSLLAQSGNPVDLSSWFKQYPTSTARHLMILRDCYRWYIRPIDSAKHLYEFGKWAEYTSNRYRRGTDAVRIFHPDPRWKPPVLVYRHAPISPRTTIFRELDPSTRIGRIGLFLLRNRTPGTGVVNVESLYEKVGGSPGLARLFKDLKDHYGFHIKSAGQKGNFIVKREANRKISRLLSTMDKEAYGLK